MLFYEYNYDKSIGEMSKDIGIIKKEIKMEDSGNDAVLTTNWQLSSEIIDEPSLNNGHSEVNGEKRRMGHISTNGMGLPVVEHPFQ